MQFSDETFQQYRMRIEQALNSARSITEKKIDEAAKLLLLNAQLATSYMVFTDSAQSLKAVDAAEFYVGFKSQMSEFDKLVNYFISTITHAE